MPTVQFKPFGTGTGANVVTQAAYEALPALTTGFSSGVAQSAQLNKVWRQSSLMSAALAQAISDLAGTDMLDDGNLATLVANIKAGILAQVQAYAPSKTGSGASGTWPVNVTGAAGSASVVPWSGVTGKPTAVSTWTNDAGYLTTGNFAWNQSGNGYLALPGGVILQWGSVYVGDLNLGNVTTGAISYPISFPKTVFQVIVSADDDSTYRGSSAWSLGQTRHAFNYAARAWDSGNVQNLVIRWFAVGN